MQFLFPLNVKFLGKHFGTVLRPTFLKPDGMAATLVTVIFNIVLHADRVTCIKLLIDGIG